MPSICHYRHRGIIETLKSRHLDRDRMNSKDPNDVLAFLEALWASEPTKAILLNIVLGALMTIRNGKKTFVAGCLEVLTGALIAISVGYGCQWLFNASDAALYAINGAVAVLGVERCKDIIGRLADSIPDSVKKKSTDDQPVQ